MSYKKRALQVTDEEIKTVWLQAKAAAYQNSEALAAKVSQFEGVIRRRWWHWNALQAPQLAAWWQYLDAVAAAGDETALYGLHERCLVPCASYPGLYPGPYLHAQCNHVYPRTCSLHAIATSRRMSDARCQPDVHRTCVSEVALFVMRFAAVT